jgi:tetratricopeptide (TPR) repeat protein
MSSLILCNTVKASRPYNFRLTDTNIYTIEELCYYIYNNIYIITEEIFDEELVFWLRDELKMTELSDKLANMISNKNNIKDIVVTVFCSADYYTEKEIKLLIDTMDLLDGMHILIRRKMKADNYMKYKSFSLAMKEYEEILKSPQLSELNDGQRGNIIHNLGVVRMNISSFSSAAKCFKEAYEKNGNRESLIHYLCTLKLDRRDEDYEDALHAYSVKSETITDIEERFLRLGREAKSSPKYIAVDRFINLKHEGRVNEYYEGIDKMINDWKMDYKRKRASV